jgi:hypothetical protein
MFVGDDDGMNIAGQEREPRQTAFHFSMTKTAIEHHAGVPDFDHECVAFASAT